MEGEKLYYFSEFVNLVYQERVEFIGEDIRLKVSSLINSYDQNFRYTDSKIFPLQRHKFYIVTHEIDNKVAGYQMFYVTPNNICELFEVFISNTLRKRSLASNLVDSTIYFVTNEFSVRKFEYHLIKQENGLPSVLTSFFTKLKSQHSELSFKDKAEL